MFVCSSQRVFPEEGLKRLHSMKEAEKWQAVACSPAMSAEPMCKEGASSIIIGDSFLEEQSFG